MAAYALEQVEIFGQGVLKSEGVVVDKEGNVLYPYSTTFRSHQILTAVGICPLH